MASLKELIEQRDAITRQIKDLHQSRRAEAIEEVKNIIKEANLSAEDVLSFLQGKRISKAQLSAQVPQQQDVREKKQRAPAAPKYRDPLSGKTWSGRGLQPLWYRHALQNGMPIENLQKPAGAVSV